MKIKEQIKKRRFKLNGKPSASAASQWTGASATAFLSAEQNCWGDEGLQGMYRASEKHLGTTAEEREHLESAHHYCMPRQLGRPVVSPFPEIPSHLGLLL